MEILKIITEKYLIWAIVLILLSNLYQKRGGTSSNKKRYATLVLAFLVLVFNILAVLIIQFKLPAWTAFIAIALVILLGYFLRRYLSIFKLKCQTCNKSLNFNDFMMQDDNICSICKTTKVESIDWESWEPNEICTLCYIKKDNQVLLIEKKTGLGRGLVNGPGGHIEKGETKEEAAIRECKEEVGLDVDNLEYKGVLDFHFLDGLKMRGYVFTTNSFSGELIETDEAKPFWQDIDSLPFDKMWEDDELWLSQVLKGQTVNGKFIFNNEEMLSHKVELC